MISFQALTLLLYVCQLAAEEGVFWVVPDFEFAVGCCTLTRSPGTTGTAHHLYARTRMLSNV